MTKVEPSQLPDEPKAPKRTTPELILEKAGHQTEAEPKTEACTT